MHSVRKVQSSVHRATDKCGNLAIRPIHCEGSNRTEYLGCWFRFRLQGQGLGGGGGIYATSGVWW